MKSEVLETLQIIVITTHISSNNGIITATI